MVRRVQIQLFAESPILLGLEIKKALLSIIHINRALPLQNKAYSPKLLYI